MNSVWKTGAIAFSMLAQLACAAGSVSEIAGTAGGAGTTTTTSTSTSTTTSTSPVVCTSPSSTGKAYIGDIEIGLGALSEPSNAAGWFYASGWFLDEPFTLEPPCAGTVVGSCCYQPQTVVQGGGWTTAGTLEVKRGATTVATLAAPKTGPYYAVSNVTTTLTWAPGDTLEVVASGGPVDAFTVTGVAPALLPDTSLPEYEKVSVSADLVITWTPSGEPCAHVDLGLSTTGAGTGPNMFCRVPDSAGTMTVPASLLGNLAAEDIMKATLGRYVPSYAVVANAVIRLQAADIRYATFQLSP